MLPKGEKLTAHILPSHSTSDRHYISANFKVSRGINFLKKIIKELGIEPERLRSNWNSSSEYGKFASVVRDMVGQIKKLGPSPLKIKGAIAQ